MISESEEQKLKQFYFSNRPKILPSPNLFPPAPPTKAAAQIFSIFFLPEMIFPGLFSPSHLN